MRWPRFLSKSSNSMDIKIEDISSQNGSFEGSIDMSSNPSDAICLRSMFVPKDQVLNITCPAHLQSQCSTSPKSSPTNVIYVPSSLQIGYSAISASDYIHQILRQKEIEIDKLVEQKESLQEELQISRLKYMETERINQELQVHLTSIRNNNDNCEFSANHKKSGDAKLNDDIVSAMPILSSSTPLRNKQLINNKSKSLMDVNITPINKNNLQGEKLTQHLAKLDIILKKYELNISASLRILQNLVERKNPNPDDLFNSFFDLEWSVNNSEDDDVIDEKDVKKEFPKTPSDYSSIELLTTYDCQKFINEQLAIMCTKAQEVLFQWDMFHQQLLICIGSDVLKTTTQHSLLVTENHVEQ